MADNGTPLLIKSKIRNSLTSLGKQNICFEAPSWNSCEKRLLCASCLSVFHLYVLPHTRTYFPLDGFPLKFIFRTFTKTCQPLRSSSKSLEHINVNNHLHFSSFISSMALGLNFGTWPSRSPSSNILSPLLMLSKSVTWTPTCNLIFCCYLFLRRRQAVFSVRYVLRLNKCR